MWKPVTSEDEFKKGQTVMVASDGGTLIEATFFLKNQNSNTVAIKLNAWGEFHGKWKHPGAILCVHPETVFVANPEEKLDSPIIGIIGSIANLLESDLPENTLDHSVKELDKKILKSVKGLWSSPKNPVIQAYWSECSQDLCKQLKDELGFPPEGAEWTGVLPGVPGEGTYKLKWSKWFKLVEFSDYQGDSVDSYVIKGFPDTYEVDDWYTDNEGGCWQVKGYTIYGKTVWKRIAVGNSGVDIPNTKELPTKVMTSSHPPSENIIGAKILGVREMTDKEILDAGWIPIIDSCLAIELDNGLLVYATDSGANRPMNFRAMNPNVGQTVLKINKTIGKYFSAQEFTSTQPMKKEVGKVAWTLENMDPDLSAEDILNMDKSLSDEEFKDAAEYLNEIIEQSQNLEDS